MAGRAQISHLIRKTSSKINWTLFVLLVFLPAAGIAQDDDLNTIHVQPRPEMLAQVQAVYNASQAQQSSQPQDQQQPPNDQPPPPLIVPAGTRLPLVLARPLSFKHAHPGDTAYLQTTFPILAGGQMAIPPGTYLQGTIDKITRRDRLHVVLAFDLRAAQVIFSTGYTVPIPGPLSANPVLAKSVQPSTGDSVPVLAATGGPATPTLPPLPSPGFSKAWIAIIVVPAAAGVLLTVAAIHHTDLLMEPGVSMEAVLSDPLILDPGRVMQAVQQYSAQTAMTPPPIPQAPRTGTCWTPGSAGTPDTIIPGTAPTIIPGTPDTTIPGDPPTTIPGTPSITIPGTPDTVIHGTPGTDPTPYPCPR
ncbi:MAG TPA: hypothetical protein VKW06_22580 [Candidatus Angelobacter sp.]|nr:hypothetical protein [Candidatus Angelobacter sp.]